MLDYTLLFIIKNLNQILKSYVLQKKIPNFYLKKIGNLLGEKNPF